MPKKPKTPKPPKKKLTASQKAEKRRRKAEFETIFVRASRSESSDGLWSKGSTPMDSSAATLPPFGCIKTDSGNI
jgi:hypothetical protein